MDKREFEKLIDDLIIAALRYDITRETNKEVEKEYIELTDKLNSVVESDSINDMLEDSEIVHSLALTDRVIQALNIKINKGE